MQDELQALQSAGAATVGAGMRERLSPAEARLYDLLVEGLTNKQLAAQLGVGLGTIRNQMTSILYKTHKRTRLQLVVAHYKGLIPC